MPDCLQGRAKARLRERARPPPTQNGVEFFSQEHFVLQDLHRYRELQRRQAAEMEESTDALSMVSAGHAFEHTWVLRELGQTVDWTTLSISWQESHVVITH